VGSVGDNEAKTTLAELLMRIEKREHVTITKHGTPVAVLIPIGEYPHRCPAAVVRALKEFADVLIVARRGGRLSEADTLRFVDLLRRLPIAVDAPPADRAFNELLLLARETGLSVYDAAYLDVALRLGLPLATQDEQLASAVAWALG
jgi:prevent-host-death family protein